MPGTSGFPGSVDSWTTNKTDSTTTATDHAQHHNDLADSVNKIETELGTNPSAGYATVAARFTAVEGALGADTTTIDVTAVPYSMSAANNGGQNKTALNLAIVDAEAAAANGVRATIVGNAGTYPLDYIGHTLTTAEVTTTGTFTIPVVSTAQYGSTGTLQLTDHGFSPAHTARTPCTFSYTGKTLTTLTGCTVSVGGVQVFDAGSLVSQSGVDTGRPLVQITDGGFDIDMPGVIFDVSGTQIYNQANVGVSAGPVLFNVGPVALAPTRAEDYMTEVIFPGQMWGSVEASIQPNASFDGTYSGVYAAGDHIMVVGDRPGDLDGGRANQKGERIELVDAREFGTVVNTATFASGATGNLVIASVLAIRQFLNPASASTTIATTALTAGTMEITCANVKALTQRTSRFTTINQPQTSGLILVDNGAGGTEIMLYEDVDYSTGKITLSQRQMVGTTTPGTFAIGASIKMIELVKVKNELMAYDSLSSTVGLNIVKRGLNGTTDATHVQSEAVHYVPRPGRIMWGVPWQGPRPLFIASEYVPGTVLNVAMDATYTQGTDQAAEVIEGTDFSQFPIFGTVLIGSEKCSYAYRDFGKLYGVTRGVDGTTVASHSTSAAITPDFGMTRLAAAITSSTIAITTNGGGVQWFSYGNTKRERIGTEVINAKSGNGTSSSSGLQYVSTTLNGSVSLSATTITLTSVASLVDPVAASCGWAFVKVDNEVIQYTGISGSTITGCVRGYQTEAAAHSTLATVFQYKTINTQAGTAGRGYAGSTAASHATGDVIDWVDATTCQLLDGAKDVNLRGFTVYKNTGSGGDGSRIQFPRYSGSGGVGTNSTGDRAMAIGVWFSTNVRVEDVTIDGPGRDGVFMQAARDVTVTNSRFYRLNGQGNGNSTNMTGACQDIVIHGNTFRDCRHGGIVSSASALPGVPRRVHFTNNHVQDMLNAGWESQAGGEDIVVDGNTFISSPGRIITLNSNRTRCSNNIIRTCHSGYAIEISNFTFAAQDFEVSGNYIEGALNGIIYSTEDAGRWSNIRGSARISDNSFRNMGGQVLTIQNQSTLLTTVPMPGLVVHGNIIRGGAPTSSTSGSNALIFLDTVSGALITDNQLLDVYGGQEGIYAAVCDDAIITSNIVIFRGVKQSAHTAQSGIRIVSGASNIVAHNRVKGSTAASPIDVTGTTATTPVDNITT